MKNSDADLLILKLIDNTISEEESVKLLQWIESEANLKYFHEYIYVNQLVNSRTGFDQTFPSYIYDKPSGRKHNKLRTAFYVAATILIILSLGLFFGERSVNGIPSASKPEPIIVNNSIVSGTNKAILSLGNGEKIKIQNGLTVRRNNMEGDDQGIEYGKATEKKEPEYHTLTIPRGGQFFVKLSDGTKVWLNSESKLKYPETFKKGKVREVELVYGEAYFEVSHSEFNSGSSFKVISEYQDITVLGTKFNIKSYKETYKSYTTLVEGKVALKTNQNNIFMSPGDQIIVDKVKETIEKHKVNVNNEISWKEGIFDFKDVEMEEIMKVLSRWYDMNVVFDKEELKLQRFNGRLNKNYSIEEILNTLMEATIINSYEINNKQLIIK